MVPSVGYEGPAPESSWRRLAGASWRRPDDPTIYGFQDLDATRLGARIESLREDGHRVTVTHAVVRALALGLAAHPDLNVVFRRRRAYRRRQVDVFIQAVVPGNDDLGSTELSGVKIRRADGLDLKEIAAEVGGKVERLRAHDDSELSRSRQGLARTPRFLLRPLTLLVRRLAVEWNLPLRWAGLADDPFGSAAVTSVGMLGIDTAFAPLYPIGGPPIVLAVGEVKPRAVVDETGAIVARPILRVAGTFDHRLLDGFHLAALSREMRRLLERDVEEL